MSLLPFRKRLLNRKSLMTCRGFSLIELVVALSILGVLTLIAVLLVNNAIRNIADRAHNANVRSIKGAVQMATFKYGRPSSSTEQKHILWKTENREDTDSASVTWPEGGWGIYLQDWPEVPRQSRAYGYDAQTQGTEYVVFIQPGGFISIHPPMIGDMSDIAGIANPGYSLRYDFMDSDSFQKFCEFVVSANCQTWHVDDGFHFNNKSWQGMVYMPNPLDQYTINIRGALAEGTSGGFGIFFDTTVDTNGLNENGFVFQFDRGMGEGQFIVRPRVNGTEGNRVASYASSNIEGIPTKEEDPQWWASPRDISIKVSNDGSNRRKTEFFIDGIFIGSYSYEGQLDENEQYYTGIRGWHTESTFYEFELK